MTEQEKRVIVAVDDDKATLNYVTSSLKSNETEVLTFGSGQDAFQHLHALLRKTGELGAMEVDLILCDWKMPGWDGVKFWKELSSTPFADVPFILMSGAVSKKELEEVARTIRLSGILLKPLNKESLISKVQAIVG